MKKYYKGFDKDLKCRGFQYEIGKTYEEKNAVLCKSGFHACESPLDVFNYYPPADNRYCEVNLDGVTGQRDNDSKVCGKKITIGAEIGIPGLVKAHVEWVQENLDKKIETATNTGDRSAATNTGYQSVATNTGYQSVATNTGYQSAATNTGDRSAATNTGNRSAATNTGYQSAATNTGYQSAATNTSDQSAATNTGDRSAATNTGNWSAATNTGNWSAATNTGNWSAATNTGYQSAAEVTGRGSVAIVTGFKSKARGSVGCAICLVERGGWDGGTCPIKNIKAVVVDGEKIKADTWYMLSDGELVEADD